MSPNIPIALSCVSLGLASSSLMHSCEEKERRRTPPSFESASLDQCAQAEAACMAVGQRLGITVTIPPWQAMVLTPILDPR
jgi:hypothetical protein